MESKWKSNLEMSAVVPTKKRLAPDLTSPDMKSQTCVNDVRYAPWQDGRLCVSSWSKQTVPQNIAQRHDSWGQHLWKPGGRSVYDCEPIAWWQVSVLSLCQMVQQGAVKR